MEPAAAVVKMDAANATQINLMNSILNSRKSPIEFNAYGIDQTQQVNGIAHASYILDRYATKNQTSINKDQELVFEITPNSNEIIQLNTLCVLLTGKLKKATNTALAADEAMQAVTPTSTPTFLGQKTFASERVAINGIVIFDSPRDNQYFNMLNRKIQKAHAGNYNIQFLETPVTNNSTTDEKKIIWFAALACNIFDNAMNTVYLLPRERLNLTLRFNPEIFTNIELSNVDCIMTGINVFDTTMTAIESKSISPAQVIQVEGYSLKKEDFETSSTSRNIRIDTTKNQHPNYLLFYHTSKTDGYTTSVKYITGYNVIQNGRNFPFKNIDLQNGSDPIMQFKRLVEALATGVGFDKQFALDELPYFVKLGETDNLAEKEVADGGSIELNVNLEASAAGRIWVWMFYKADVIIEGVARNVYIAANNNV